MEGEEGIGTMKDGVMSIHPQSGAQAEFWKESLCHSGIVSFGSETQQEEWNNSKREGGRC